MMTKTITVTHSPCADDETPFSYEENGFIRWVDEVFQENYKKSPDTPFPTLEQAFILLEKLGYKWEVSVPARKCYLCESEDKLVSWGSFCFLCPSCVSVRDKYEKYEENPDDVGLQLFYQAFREGQQAPSIPTQPSNFIAFEIEEAINDWLDEGGETRLEAHRSLASGQCYSCQSSARNREANWKLKRAVRERDKPRNLNEKVKKLKLHYSDYATFVGEVVKSFEQRS